MLADKMKQHAARVWLVNTGWSGGGYGVGNRMKLSLTRTIVDAIHSGTLADVTTQADSVFGIGIPESCPGVNADVLHPRTTWKDGAAFDAAAKKLAGLFVNNFKQYEAWSSAEVRAAGPKG